MNSAGRSLTLPVGLRSSSLAQRRTGGEKLITGSGDTIAALLLDLDASHPGLRERLITPEGGLHRFVNVYINDEDVRFLGALDAKVNDGDTVTILPAVAGGASGLLMLAATASHRRLG